MPTVSAALITHNACHLLPRSLPQLLISPLLSRVLVVNSSSTDGTVALAEKMGAETLVVPRASFNHGTTRELARKTLATDIVVMLTPDAYFADEHTLEKLIAPIVEKKAAVSYARQLPHVGHRFLEGYYRHYNYPEEGQLRSLKDIERYGAYTFFCSNSCAAWSFEALEEIGGFSPVLLGEDTLAVAKLLHRGYSVAYVSAAQVHHSHSYSLKEEFQRSFDTGLARELYSDYLGSAKSDRRRGVHYVKSLCKTLLRKKPHLLPLAIAQSTCRFAGYTLGRHAVSWPLSLKKLCSSQDFYWADTL